jgi:hypothetical protein
MYDKNDRYSRLANELYRLENEIKYEFPTTLPDDYLCKGYDPEIAFGSISEIVYNLSPRGIPFTLCIFCERAFALFDKQEFENHEEWFNLFDMYLSQLAQSGQEDRCLSLANAEIQRMEQIDRAILNSRFGLKIRLHRIDALRRSQTTPDVETELATIVALMIETTGKRAGSTMLARSMLLRSRVDAKKPGHTEFADELVEDEIALNGPNYHGTLTAQFWRALAYEMDGQPQKALQFLEEILPLKKKIKGNRHGDTLQTQERINRLKASLDR